MEMGGAWYAGAGVHGADAWMQAQHWKEAEDPDDCSSFAPARRVVCGDVSWRWNVGCSLLRLTLMLQVVLLGSKRYYRLQKA